MQVGFESGTSCLTTDNGDAYNLEEGCKILSIDSQHTQFVPMDDVYKWLQVKQCNLFFLFSPFDALFEVAFDIE